jgi:hypothetical protein
MNRDGQFEHDAAIMRSRDLRSGAVAGVRDVRDPILLARLVLEQTRHCLVVGEGAEALGRAHGVGHFGRDEVWTAKAEAAHRAVLEGRAAPTTGPTPSARSPSTSPRETSALPAQPAEFSTNYRAASATPRCSAPASTPTPSSAPAAPPASARPS